jgi:aspartate kinase
MAANCVVMKFGGTSVGDSKAIARVAEIVRGRMPQRPIVVVSAMAKVTDQLLQMARAAGEGDRQKALILARECRERHYNTAGELLGTALFTQFHSDLGSEFEELEELLRGIAAVGELTPRTTDHVAAFGEVLSSKLVTAALSAHDLPATHVDSRDCIVTDETFMRAAPLFDAPTRAGLRPSASKRQPNSRTSAQRCCTLQPCYRRSRKTFRFTS